MKIYLVLALNGHEVFLFCDNPFKFSALPCNIEEEDNITIRRFPVVHNRFLEDKNGLDWCEVCVMVLPCGKSSHLEAGYAKGCGKELIIFSPNGFQKGDLDVMYDFSDRFINDEDNLLYFLTRQENDR